MDVILLVTIAVGLIVALVGLWLFKKSSGGNSASSGSAQQQPILPGARRRQPVFTRRQGGNRAGGSATQQEDDDDDGEPLDIQLPDGKVGAKKMAKLQAKAEKKSQREAEQRDREDKKQKQEKEDEQRRKIEEKEKAEEKKKEDEERKIREEKERQEHEEYLKMKAAFSVEAEGFEEGNDEPENALQQFVTYIKDNKVVVMEDLAALFGLKTAAAIQRVETLQADGILSGVMDDRGKFIFVSPEELHAVANFVRQRGRVSIVELVENSNRLVDLTPKLSTKVS